MPKAQAECWMEFDFFKNNIALLGLSYWRVMALLQKQPFLPMAGHLPNENGTASDWNYCSVILFKEVDRPFYYSFNNSQS